MNNLHYLKYYNSLKKFLAGDWMDKQELYEEYDSSLKYLVSEYLNEINEDIYSNIARTNLEIIFTNDSFVGIDFTNYEGSLELLSDSHSKYIFIMTLIGQNPPIEDITKELCSTGRKVLKTEYWNNINLLLNILPNYKNELGLELIGDILEKVEAEVDSYDNDTTNYIIDFLSVLPIEVSCKFVLPRLKDYKNLRLKEAVLFFCNAANSQE